MKAREVLNKAKDQIEGLKGKTLDILNVTQPSDTEYALHLAKVVSKLSPILGNMIEYSIVKFLNENKKWSGLGKWLRQDPGFPDAVFVDQKEKGPLPGIEIKTWFPLATEITARFRESVTHFENDNVDVAVVAWVPEHILYGKPKIIDIWVDTGSSLALARDEHYHNPPDYLVIEPRDTSARTSNLQQTNALGFKFQGTPAQFKKAEEIVKSWGSKGKAFDFSPKYQARLAQLMGMFPYRLDTNFAKIDRIKHLGLEEFKKKVLNTKINEHTIKEWSLIVSEDGEGLSKLLEKQNLVKDLV